MTSAPPGPGGAADEPTERWAQVRALFDAVMALPAAQRSMFLERSTATPAVRDEVRSLVEFGDDEGFLSAPAAALPVLNDDLRDDAKPTAVAALQTELQANERLGSWQTVEKLGSGGMGDVWLARRADGAYQGEAAIKVLRRGMDSSRVLDRFALEQQALARLTHPHIAHLLDAGRTPFGAPYFVMERVHGLPIDKACAGLSLEARLQLFLQLADAVAHAHRKLLVHRDLKPSNVLVTEAGQVKLLDFGIAKALGPAEGLNPEQTQAEERPFTPHYASPEQVRGEVVSTATDIYSLGVLLYVMLTGTRPYGRSASTPQQAARSVLEEEPTKPSSLSPGIATDPLWLATRKRLRGDLDNILLKALDKTIERRYVSVDALAADVTAYLKGYPVSAQAASWAYRTRKFVARNRWGVAAGGVAGFVVVVATGMALWQGHLAQQRFAQVRQLANQLVFKYHDQIEALPGATQVREALLVDAASFIDSLHQTALTDPLLADELANTYYRISRLQGVDQSINTGQHDKAEVNLDKALALTALYVNRADVSIQALTNAINMHISKGEIWQRSGQLMKADAALREGLPMLERALARDAKDTWALASAISLHGVHARILGGHLGHAHLGRWRDACAATDRARAAAQATIVADPANVYGPDSLAFTLGEQAQCRFIAGQLDEALALSAEQIKLRDLMAAKMPDDMDFRYQRSTSRALRARVLAASGQTAAAIELLALASELAQSAASLDVGNVAGAQRVLALRVLRLEVLVMGGQLAAAQAAADEVLPQLAGQTAQPFAAKRGRADALVWAARAWRLADPTRALVLAQEALQLASPRAPDDDNEARRWQQAQALGEMALARNRQGQLALAKTTARQAMALWLASPPSDGPAPVLAPWMAPVAALAGI